MAINHSPTTPFINSTSTAPSINNTTTPSPTVSPSVINNTATPLSSTAPSINKKAILQQQLQEGKVVWFELQRQGKMAEARALGSKLQQIMQTIDRIQQ